MSFRRSNAAQAAAKSAKKHKHDYIFVAGLTFSAVIPFFMDWEDQQHFFCLCGKSKIVRIHHRQWHFKPVVTTKYYKPGVKYDWGKEMKIGGRLKPNV